jgi:hypothetical protein
LSSIFGRANGFDGNIEMGNSSMGLPEILKRLEKEWNFAGDISPLLAGAGEHQNIHSKIKHLFKRKK